MGLCTSSIQEVALHSVNCSIDRAIELERAERENEIKLLLLGAGETGKSTILKQFRLIYGTGFTDQERISFRTAIIVNICQSIKTLLLAMDTLEIPFGFDPALYHETQIEDEEETLVRKIEATTVFDVLSPPQIPQYLSFASHSSMDIVRPSTTVNPRRDPLAIIASKLYKCSTKTAHIQNAIEAIVGIDIGVGFLDDVDESVIGAIKTIWKDPGIQYCFKRANEFQLNDTCQYYLNDCDRFFASDYTPSDDDILNVRIMTLKVSETKVKVGDKVYKIFDVGGQRIERKKWAALFDDVIAIIFVVALSSYNQVCFEDHTTNRITESLNLFSAICNHPLFKDTAMLLFLNKTDIFQEKLQFYAVSDYFPEFTGPNEYEPAGAFFHKLFIDLNKYKDKKLYTHYVNAIDTKQTEAVLLSVNNILVRLALKDMGLI